MNKPETNTTLSVSELNRKAKSLLELHLNQIWVEGEVSNLSQPGSGHWYFTLKDAKAQIRCAMFRNRNLLVRTKLKAGDYVRVRARVSLYEPRGDYQLIADHLEPAGEGALQQQFEQLKTALSKEGLFQEESKKPLPTFAKKIAVITSPTGAALHDILQVLARRNPSIEVVVVPSVVQGEEAPAELQKALLQACSIESVDVIILGRGGGSLEDLWAFNDEMLARQIFNCDIPIVSAVGHEIDFSISDFVADLRAPTPSAAAELVSFDQAAVINALQTYTQRLALSMNKRIHALQTETINYAKRLKHPGDRINQWQQRTDFCETRLIDAIQNKLKFQQQDVALLRQSLYSQSPKAFIKESRDKLSSFGERLSLSAKNLLEKKQMRFNKTSGALHIVSPLATLERGYTITKSEYGNVLRSVENLKENQTVELNFHDGNATAKLAKITTKKPASKGI